LTTFIKLVVKLVTNDHVHCELWEGEGETEGTFTYAKNGDLVFSRNAYWAFRDSLQRGRGTRTNFVVKDEDMAERIDWEIANKSQS
jgi:hypothetical protein